MRRIRRAVSFLALVFGFIVLATQSVSAAWNPNLIMDDVVFDDSATMSVADIQNFLNQQNGCLKTYQSPYPHGYNSYGDNVSAATVIFRASEIYGVNPRVILATLQKESSVVTGDCTYVNTAMGMGCPDGGQCPAPGYEGFSKQVTKGTWLLKFGKERANGNVGWEANDGVGGDPYVYYGGPMTQGCYKRQIDSPTVCYDGYWTIDGQTVHIDTGTTGSMYNYTPHFHGNQNFVTIFENWFGGTISSSYYACKNGVNVVGAGTGVRVMPNRPTWGADNLSLVQLNDTGSKCIEVHTFGGHEFSGWLQHVATNRHAITPADARALTADTNGDGRDEIIIVEYRNTSSGRIEMHGFTSDYQHWASHIASNRPAANPADSEVIAADTNGDGRDELYLVDYRNTASGMIELHGWSSNYQQWISHTATNRPAIDPADAEVISADINGDVRDEFLLVQYRNTGSDRIEVHGWLPGQQQWFVHTATNHGAINPGTRANPIFEVISADVNGNLAQELHLIQYGQTNSGRVEIHTWADGQQAWTRHAATAQGSY